MKAEWTPGPWRSEYDDNGFFFVDAPNRPSPYVAATGGEGSENEANARLIAAAPDLLRALQLIVRFGHLGCVHVDGHATPTGGKKPATKDVWQFPRHLLTEIEIALTKAGANL